ncbi:MAG: hypothetical protein ACFFDP_12715 [Promethearchaeota archaeon]
MVVWVVIPLSLISFAFFRRFATEQRGFWFFDVNTAISLTIVLYILLTTLRLRRWSVSTSHRILLFCLPFQVPISILSYLGGGSKGVPWAIGVRVIIESDGGIQAAIGLLQGFVGLYVYLLGIRMGKSLLSGTNSNLSQNLRTLGSMVTFFAVIIALSIFSVSAPYEVFWPLRSILLTSGFLLGTIAMTTGLTYGIEENAVLTFLGGIFSFCASFVVGVTVLPLTRLDSQIYPTLVAFTMNTLLAVGILGYLVNCEQGPIADIFRSFINRI